MYLIPEHLQLLICPNCRESKWNDHQKTIECRNCQNHYSSDKHVVDLLPKYNRVNSSDSISDYTQPILRRLGMHGDDVTAEMDDILVQSTDQHSDLSYLTAEMHDVINRFQLFNDDYCIEYMKHYIEPILPKETTIYRNIRVKNTGKYPWNSKSSPPLFMSYHWLNENREVIIFDGIRTAFPVVIESGREITLPLHIATPKNQGKYILQVLFIHEGVKWIDESIMEISVEITKSVNSYNIKRNKNNDYDYTNDHNQGKKIIENYIHRNYNHSLELLEIGGGSHPQMASLNINLPYRTINADINVSILKIGSLFYRYHMPDEFNKLTFMAFDANDPPFRENTFNGIVLFSALHHFPDPDRLIQTCYKLLEHGGFLAIMCEPVNKGIYDEVTVHELSSGINEQVFTEEEYMNIFKQADFHIELIQIDGNSLKVILKK